MLSHNKKAVKLSGARLQEMKYIKYLFIIATLLLIYNQCSADNPKSNNSSNNNNNSLLSLKEIDLLVGTPEGIAEPLDSRRNTITKENQIDYSNFLDEDALSLETETDFEWKDAEDSAPNENQVENQLMDLLAETEELEKTDEIYYYDEDNETATNTEKI